MKFVCWTGSFYHINIAFHVCSRPSSRPVVTILAHIDFNTGSMGHHAPSLNHGNPLGFLENSFNFSGFFDDWKFFQFAGIFRLGASVGFLVVTSLVIPLTELYVAYNFRGLRISEHEQFMDYRLKITYE